MSLLRLREIRVPFGSDRVNSFFQAEPGERERPRKGVRNEWHSDFSLSRFLQSFARLAAWDGQDLVRLGPALDRPGLDAAGAVADAVTADRGQQRLPETLTLLLLRPAQRVLERRHRLQRTLEAHLPRRHPGLRRRPHHRPTDQIITQ